MPFKVQVGPHQVSIHHGQTVLVSEPDGQINWPSEKGLYFFDTRVISSWTIYANGEPWDLLNGGAITHYASRIYLTNRKIRTAGWRDSAAHPRACHQPVDQRRHARGPRRYQQRHEAGALSARDRGALRFRRHFRSQVRTTSCAVVRLPRSGRRRSSSFGPATETAISSAPSRSCPPIEGRPRQLMPMAGSASKSTSIPVRPGTAACSTRSKTVSGSFAPPDECVDQHHKTHHAETLSDWLRLGAEDPHAATRNSIVFIVRRSRTWRRYGSRSPAPITRFFCRPPACRGLWPRSAATA